MMFELFALIWSKWARSVENPSYPFITSFATRRFSSKMREILAAAHQHVSTLTQIREVWASFYQQATKSQLNYFSPYTVRMRSTQSILFVVNHWLKPPYVLSRLAKLAERLRLLLLPPRLAGVAPPTFDRRFRTRPRPPFGAILPIAVARAFSLFCKQLIEIKQLSNRSSCGDHLWGHSGLAERAVRNYRVLHIV